MISGDQCATAKAEDRQQCCAQQRQYLHAPRQCALLAELPRDDQTATVGQRRSLSKCALVTFSSAARLDKCDQARLALQHDIHWQIAGAHATRWINQKISAQWMLRHALVNDGDQSFEATHARLVQEILHFSSHGVVQLCRQELVRSQQQMTDDPDDDDHAHRNRRESHPESR